MNYGSLNREAAIVRLFNNHRVIVLATALILCGCSTPMIGPHVLIPFAVQDNGTVESEAAAASAILGQEIRLNAGTKSIAESLGKNFLNVEGKKGNFEFITIAGAVVLSDKDHDALRASIRGAYQQCSGELGFGVEENSVSSVSITWERRAKVLSYGHWNYPTNIVRCCENNNGSLCPGWIATKAYRGTVKATIELGREVSVGPSASCQVSGVDGKLKAQIGYTNEDKKKLKFESKGWNIVEGTSWQEICVDLKALCENLPRDHEKRKVWKCDAIENMTYEIPR